jgi:hypothetical protein
MIADPAMTGNLQQRRLPTRGFDSWPREEGLLEDCRYPLPPARRFFLLFPLPAQFMAENSL